MIDVRVMPLRHPRNRDQNVLLIQDFERNDFYDHITLGGKYYNVEQLFTEVIFYV